MQNWNSKEIKYTPIQNQRTIHKALLAREMKSQGIPVTVISHTLQMSKSRIYEYLREDFLAPNTDNK